MRISCHNDTLVNAIELERYPVARPIPKTMDRNPIIRPACFFCLVAHPIQPTIIADAPITNEKIEIESNPSSNRNPIPHNGTHVRADHRKSKSRFRNKQEHRFRFRSVEFMLDSSLVWTPAWQVTRQSQRALVFCGMPAS